MHLALSLFTKFCWFNFLQKMLFPNVIGPVSALTSLLKMLLHIVPGFRSHHLGGTGEPSDKLSAAVKQWNHPQYFTTVLKRKSTASTVFWERVSLSIWKLTLLDLYCFTPRIPYVQDSNYFWTLAEAAILCSSGSTLLWCMIRLDFPADLGLGLPS